MSTERRDKINYYLDIADTVMERGTCLRRRYGAIIVKNDQIISTGYVGAPRGRKNCSETMLFEKEFNRFLKLSSRPCLLYTSPTPPDKRQDPKPG